MFVTDIRFGELPVVKLYIGGRVVWHREKLTGIAESASSAIGHLHMAATGIMIGDAVSKSYADVQSALLTIEYIMGKSEIKIGTRANCTIVDILSLIGRSDSVTGTKTHGFALNVVHIDGASENKSEVRGISRDHKAILAKSEEIVRHIASSGGLNTPVLLPVGGCIVHDTDANSTGRTPYVLDIASNVASNLTTSSVGACVIPLKAIAYSESSSYGTVVGKTLDVTRLYGDEGIVDTAAAATRLLGLLGITTDVQRIDISTETTGRILDLLLMRGDGDSVSDALGMAIQLNALRSIGYGDSKSYSEDFMGRYFIERSKSDTNVEIDSDENIIQKYHVLAMKSSSNTETQADSPVALWYPPIGDGVILVEEEGVDITKNGNILEIQQAYEINTTDGILEVI